MKLKRNNFSNRSSKNIRQINIFSNINNSNILKNKENKIDFYRNNISKDNYVLWKTNNSINDNSKSNKFINSNNFINHSIIETNTKNEKKLKNPIFSHSIIKNNNYNNKSLSIILQNNNYNVSKIHNIISLIEKKLNILHNTNKENNDNVFSFNSSNITINTIKNSPNKIIKNNDKRIRTFNNSKLISKYKKPTFLSTYKENINLNKMKNKRRNSINIISGIRKSINKNDLIPYPYKRVQKKLRRYFSFYNNIKLPEEEYPINIGSNRMPVKNGEIKKYCNNLINNNIIYIKNDINKEIISSNKKYKVKTKNKVKNKKEVSTKEDKSVGTENTFYGRNIHNLKYQKKNNKTENKSVPLFNNELIAQMTNTNDNNVIITSKELENDANKRKIYIYYKNS